MSLDFLDLACKTWEWRPNDQISLISDHSSPSSPKGDESADLVPAQVLHAKVQSCRADTRKTSFWIGAIREAKESSAAEKQ
jgi:hypothetical protein